MKPTPDVTYGARRTARGTLAVIAALGLTACGSSSAPPASPSPAPTGDADVLALDVGCTASLLIGEKSPCVAIARLRTGQTPIVQAEWSSSRPDVVDVDTLGVANGRSAGQAVISGSYRGREDSAPIAVTAEDALRIKAAAEQGDFRPGTTATMWLQGYYSVNSAATGRLSLRISDQTGTIAATAPLTVAKGGDFFLLSSTFTVPQNSPEVCRTAILEVGSVVIAEPTTTAMAFRCIPIRR